MKETLEENNNMSSDTPSGTSLAESVIDSENAENDKLTVRTVFKLLRKWWMIPVYLFFAVLLIIFISRGDEKDLYKAHFKAEDEVTIGDVAYRLLSKDDKDNYIGSFVSTKLTALKDKKIATMRSYILYVSVFYSVQGVDDLEYVMDGKNSVYVKSENYEKAKAYFENEAHITSYKMTGKSKKMENLSNLENEKVEALYELMENGTETDVIRVCEKRFAALKKMDELARIDEVLQNQIAETYKTQGGILAWEIDRLETSAHPRLAELRESQAYREMLANYEN